MRFWQKVVKPGQRYGDMAKRRVLTVLSVENGGPSMQAPVQSHPQLYYAKCRADWQDGSMSVLWVTVHTLISSDYKRLPKLKEPVA